MKKMLVLILITSITWLALWGTLDNSRPEAAQHSVRIGAQSYLCRNMLGHQAAFQGAHYQIDGIQPVYDRAEKSLNIEFQDETGHSALLQQVETGLRLSDFTFRGWSSSCRYFAASVSAGGHDETVVWDVLKSRRVDSMPGQNSVNWSSFDDALVMETANGAILWNLTTNMQITLTTEVLETPDYRRAYEKLNWDAHQLFIVPVDAVNTLHIFDVTTGEQLATLALDNPESIASYELSQDGQRVVLFDNETIMVWNRDDHSSVTVTLDAGMYPLSAGNVYLSPDNRLLAALIWDEQFQRRLLVWDLADSAEQPAIIHTEPDIAYDALFRDNVTLAAQNAAGFNLLTGAVLQQELAMRS